MCKHTQWWPVQTAVRCSSVTVKWARVVCWMWFVFIYGAGWKAIGFHMWLRLDHWEITAGLGTASAESTQRPACAPGLTLTSAQGLPASVRPPGTSLYSEENYCIVQRESGSEWATSEQQKHFGLSPAMLYWIAQQSNWMECLSGFWLSRSSAVL